MVSPGVETVWIPLVVVALTGWFTLEAWRRRPKPGMTTLALVLAAVCGWNAVRIGSHLTTGFTLSVAFSNLDYTLAMATSALALAFALEFTGREHWLRGWRLGALVALPALDVALIWLNPVLGLFRTNPHVDHGVFGHLAFETGIAYQFHFAMAYAYATVASLLIVAKVVRSRALRRRQSVAVLIAVAAPLVGHLLKRLGVSDALFAPSFAVTGIALYVAVVNYQLTDVTPVARATVMDRLDVGILVVDRDDRVADVNRTGKRLIGHDADASLVGKSLADVLAAVPEIYDRYRDVDETSEVVTVDFPAARRALQVDVSPFEDRLGRRVGRIFLLQDVTERERRERELERTNEQLSTLAGVVSHDLRNPLQVAMGHTEMLDDEAAAPIQSSLERMNAIVEDVLAMVREGSEVEEPEPVALATVARRAWDQVDAESATLTVATEATVEANPDRLQRLLENLFRNAVEHGSTGGQPSADGAADERDPSLSVTVGEFEPDVEAAVESPFGFFVEDDGPGIPEGDREAVFESGYSTNEGGTGLGLAIVENIATAHGWTVSLTEGSDGGARFEFTGVQRVDANPGDDRSADGSPDAAQTGTVDATER